MQRHVDDRDLVSYIDGELSSRQRARLARHLEMCARCEEREAQLRSAAGDVTGCYRMADGVLPRSLDYRRVRMEAALREAAASAPAMWPGQIARWSLPRGVGAAMVVAAMSVLLIVVRPATEAISSGAPAGALPESSITPGAVSQLTTAELCNGVRPSRWVTEPVRQQVLRAYGMEGVSAAAYELDALITPELGGSTDPANLWPQRYHSPVWNARVKDELEELLPAMVCREQISLAQAQREIAIDWIAAYKRYFNTQTPLRAHLIPSPEEEEELQFVSQPSTRVAVRLVSFEP